MPYEQNMSEEKAPNVKKLIPEGWREFEVKAVEDTVAKSGNSMFVVDLYDKQMDYTDKVYMVSVKGKRWYLKDLLSACEIKPDESGVFKWDIPDLIGKKVEGLVEHEPNKYINRAGIEVETTQHRISKFRATTVAWDEE